MNLWIRQTCYGLNLTKIVEINWNKLIKILKWKSSL